MIAIGPKFRRCFLGGDRRSRLSRKAAELLQPLLQGSAMVEQGQRPERQARDREEPGMGMLAVVGRVDTATLPLADNVDSRLKCPGNLEPHLTRDQLAES